MTPTGLRRCAASIAVAATSVVASLGFPSTAWADDLVTYEVVSSHVRTANIQYQDAAGRMWAVGTPLPWRIDAPVAAVRGAPPEGSQVRADWRGSAAPGRWVTVRIIYQGEVICQSTLDIGNATCYGITARIT